MKRTVLLIILVFLLASCSPKGLPTAEYQSVTGSVLPGESSRVEMDDGAAIVIPQAAYTEPLEVTIERNPPKAETLADPGDEFVPLGDFYEFSVAGGAVTGDVEITLPFDPARIPDGDGALVVAFPGPDGWEFVPAVANGNTITIRTEKYADPVIAWHFTKSTTVCEIERSYTLDLAARTITVFGRVSLHVVKTYQSSVVDDTVKPMADLAVTLVLNDGGWRGSDEAHTYYIATDSDGRFTLVLPDQDLQAGWNWLFISASCPTGVDTTTMETRFSESREYLEFKNTLPVLDMTPETDLSTASECEGSNCKLLVLENYSGSTDTITLTGPAKYTFPFGPGVSTHSLIYGTYEFVYTSCDGKWTSPGTLSADEGWSIAGPPNCNDP